MGIFRLFLSGLAALCLLTFLIYIYLMLNTFPAISSLEQLNRDRKISMFKDYEITNKHSASHLNVLHDELDASVNLEKPKFYNDLSNNLLQIISSSSTTKSSTIFEVFEKLSLEELGRVNNDHDLEVKKKGMKQHAFNVLVSERLGYNRKIPDTRHSLCKKKMNDYNKNLMSKTSIVICFYNEAKSTLLRTVYSILNRTNQNLIQDIILVNDASDNDDIEMIKEVIELMKNDKVKLFTLPERSGLMRARMFGARKAKGEVLFFLDSHCEVNQGWLEPLLDLLNLKPNSVAIPIIDTISAYTFEYNASPLVKGGFNWGLHFKWDSIPPLELKHEQDFVKHIKTPTMAGGLFAINKTYFFAMGGYDEGMDIWGGENLEMSFRMWMCGGEMYLVPCSRIGHVFRPVRPYGSVDGSDTFTRNSMRLAKVWLDEYEKYYLESGSNFGNFFYGDISDRIALRKKLNCSSFNWYIQNIYPELKPPKKINEKKQKEQMEKVLQLKPKFRAQRKAKIINQFQIELSGTNWCIESEKEVTMRKGRLVLNKCAAIKRQMWFETEDKQFILSGLLCLDSTSKEPFLEKCHELGESQDWRHSNQRNTMIYNMAAGLCLGVKRIRRGEAIILSICGSDETMKWNLLVRMT